MAKTTAAKQTVCLIEAPTQWQDTMKDLCDYLNEHYHDYKFAFEDRGLGCRINVAGVTSGLVFEKLAGLCVGYVDGYHKGLKRRLNRR